MSSYRILVASYTESIVTLDFKPPRSPDDGLSVVSSLTVGFHPSWITQDATNPSVFYTGLEQPEGRLVTLQYDVQTGGGKTIGDIASGGHSPCSILSLDSEVLVSNYMSGTVRVFNTQPVGQLNERQPVLKFSGTGPNADRQEQSHPHQIYLIKREDHEEVLVPDLGADRVWRLIRGKTGHWQLTGHLAFDKHLGGGPRHVAFHENVLYTLLELSSELTAHSFPPLPASNAAQSSTGNETDAAAPKLLASASTLLHPPASPPQPMLAAELLFPPPTAAFPKAHLYVSNRNDPHPGGDTIAIFEAYDAAHAPGVLRLVKEVRTGLKHLRGMIFFGPEDRYLIAGGNVDGGIKVFERKNGGADLKEVAHLPVGEGEEGNLKPTGFVVL